MRREHLLGPILVASLLGVALLQYRWIGEVSRAERTRLQRSLTEAAEQFAADLDQELTQALVLLARPGQDRGGRAHGEILQQRWEMWRHQAQWPGLVEDIYWLYWARGELLRLDAESGALLGCAWPRELEVLRPNGNEDWTSPRTFREKMGVRGDIPAILVPDSPRRGPQARDQGSLVLIILLDAQYLKTVVLPDLVARHFSPSEGKDVELRVVEKNDSGRVVYRSNPEEDSSRGREGDVVVDLLRIRAGEDSRELWLGPEEDLSDDEGEGLGGRGRGPYRALRTPRRAPIPEAFLALSSPGWQLLVSHRQGSLEKAVASARQKNLALSAGILLILGVSVLLTAVASRRAQRLERQHVDFVAGVSHELRSPLASIRSAAQNLADGVVQEKEQVERYGHLIDREGRRLGAMVEQVLGYAGVRSEAAQSREETVGVETLVKKALSDCRWFLEERDLEVELVLEDHLPDVVGDQERLRRALVNLIDNAAKYGSPGGWVRTGALLAPGKKEVVLFVEDGGPGFDPAERDRLCEPFVRGAASNIPGSGLGLSLVSKIAAQHHGRLELSRSDEGGARAALVLPAQEGDRSTATKDRG